MAEPAANDGVLAVTVAWAQLSLAADAFRRGCATELGITVTELNAVAHLSVDGPIPAGRLAEAVGVSLAATTTVVDHLVAAGFARRSLQPDDGRVRLVALTPGGRHAAEWVTERAVALVGPPLAGLDAPQQEQLARLMRALARSAAAG